MDYVVAIPSHNRVSILRSRSLAYLSTTNVPLDRVHIITSNAEQAAAYRAALPRLKVVEPEAPLGGLAPKQNWIEKHWPVGTRVFVMEDDVQLVSGAGGKNDAAHLRDLHGAIVRGFSELGEGPGLWGIVPHGNAFYFSGKVKKGLGFIPAYAFGFVATHDPRLAVTYAPKNDYERTCLYWEAFRNIVRLDWIGVRTDNYKTPGGIQSDHTRDERAKIEEEACAYLVGRFPTLLRRNEKKKSIFPELSFIRQKA